MEAAKFKRTMEAAKFKRTTETDRRKRAIEAVIGPPYSVAPFPLRRRIDTWTARYDTLALVFGLIRLFGLSMLKSPEIMAHDWCGLLGFGLMALAQTKSHRVASFCRLLSFWTEENQKKKPLGLVLSFLNDS